MTRSAASEVQFARSGGSKPPPYKIYSRGEMGASSSCVCLIPQQG